MNSMIDRLGIQTYISPFNAKERSDSLMNYFLIGYFALGLVFAVFYDTWLTAFGAGGTLLLVYYSIKMAMPRSELYQYVLGFVLGGFMIQFIYQMRGMSEMHYFAFIGSAILITYQNWKLQIPIFIVVIIHHAIFGYLHNQGYSDLNFTQIEDLDLRTFIIHLTLAAVIFFICGLWGYQLKKHNEKQLFQSLQMAELQKKSQLSQQRKEYGEERITILESIGDSFFALDNNWRVTYWNKMAENVIHRRKHEILGRNLWEEFPEAVDSLFYTKYHEALATKKPVHFEEYYKSLGIWLELSAYPSNKGLSVYFKDITERKEAELMLIASEQKYSELFSLNPLPMWVFDIDTLEFLDVNTAAVKTYGYTRDEFLLMSVKDIRPAEDIDELENNVAKFRANNDFAIRGTFRHKKKNGAMIQAQVHSYNIAYKGRRAKVILAEDVTERMNHLNAIKEQNEKLKQISWMQSHVIRAPLARIMGLLPLIENFSDDACERETMLKYMTLSVNELDEVIRNIIDKTAVVDAES